VPQQLVLLMGLELSPVYRSCCPSPAAHQPKHRLLSWACALCRTRVPAMGWNHAPAEMLPLEQSIPGHAATSAGKRQQRRHWLNRCKKHMVPCKLPGWFLSKGHALQLCHSGHGYQQVSTISKHRSPPGATAAAAALGDSGPTQSSCRCNGGCPRHAAAPATTLVH